MAGSRVPALALVLPLVLPGCVALEDDGATDGPLGTSGSTLDASAGPSTSHDDGTGPSPTSQETSSGDPTSDPSADTSADTSASSPGTSSDEASGSSGDPIPADCAPITDCEACGALAGCGWCGATGTCSAGDGEGPSAGSCTGGWVIEGDFFSCPAADCFARTSCGECQDAFTGCGWCASSGTCMAGAPDMPAAPAVCADQQWYFDICPEDCADEMTCVSCTGTVGCGWCPGGSGCAAGTDAGPLEGSCASGWSLEVDSCF